MTLVDVGSPVVLFSTRDKKFVSGLSKTEINRIVSVTGGGLLPWICNVKTQSWVAIGIGQMLRYVAFYGSAGSHVWLDASGALVLMTTQGDLVRIPSEYWKESEYSSTYLTPGLGDGSGIFQLGDDKIYIKRATSIAAWNWDSETGVIGAKLWETSISGSCLDFQWCKDYNELVVPNSQGDKVQLIDGSTGKIKQIRDIGHKSMQVARDKYGRYWFQEHFHASTTSHKITVCEPDTLEFAYITINGTTYHGTFPLPYTLSAGGISENGKGDIIVTDLSRSHITFFSVDDDYSHPILMYLGGRSHSAAPLGENDFWLVEGRLDQDICYLVNPYQPPMCNPITEGDYIISAMGDPGLARWKTWGRSWKPDVSAIYDYLFHPTES